MNRSPNDAPGKGPAWLPTWVSGPFARNVAKLLTGTVVAQGLRFLLLPVLSRLYDPSDFGMLAMFEAVVVIGGTLACLRYDFAVVMPREERVAHNLLAVALLSTALLSVLVLAAHKPLAVLIADWVATADLNRYFWLVPFCILGTGAFQTLNFWATRKKRFGALARIRVGSVGSRLAVQVGAGLRAPSSAGLIAGYACGVVLPAILLTVHLRQSFKAWRRDVSWAGMVAAARSYRKFPQFLLPSAVLSILETRLVTFLFARYFGIDMLGQYAMVFSAFMALNILATAVSQVFYPESVEAARDERLGRVLQRVTELLILLLIPFALLIMALGDRLFPLLLGEAWAVAGQVSRVLVPFFCLRVLLSATTTFIAQERFGWAITVTACYFSAALGSIYVAGAVLDLAFLPAMALFSTAMASVYLLANIANLRLARVSLGVLTRRCVTHPVTVTSVILFAMVLWHRHAYGW